MVPENAAGGQSPGLPPVEQVLPCPRGRPRRAPSEITQGELNEKLILINTPLVQGSLCFLRGGIPGSMSAIPRRTL